jgi:hypothetical protein
MEFDFTLFLIIFVETGLVVMPFTGRFYFAAGTFVQEFITTLVKLPN